MTNDITNELDAVQCRAVSETNALFQLVSPDSDAYQKAQERFNRSMSHFHVIRIERIDNPALREQCSGAGMGSCRWLFHGSNNSNYVSIAKNGFDIKRSKNGLLGVGVYFAENACYSNGYTNSLAIDTNSDTDPVMNMLLCRVQLTPADHSKNAIHCIVGDRRAYPEYIIYYSKSEPAN